MMNRPHIREEGRYRVDEALEGQGRLERIEKNPHNLNVIRVLLAHVASIGSPGNRFKGASVEPWSLQDGDRLIQSTTFFRKNR